MKKDYIPEQAERRFFVPKIELRAMEESGEVEGIAAVVERKTDLGWADEMIAKGAFDDVLGDDVVALFNHDPNYPLARTTATGDAKLDLFLNDNGDLGYRFKVSNTTAGKDLAENIRNGVINKSSFAFTVAEEEWQWADGKNERDLRVIKKLGRLYDVSPVTYPAYNDTSVAARSMESAHKTEKVNLNEYRQRLLNRKFNLNKNG